MVGVEADLLDVERLRPIDVRHRDLDQFEPHVARHVDLLPVG
jgi:hypothetical protein